MSPDPFFRLEAERGGRSSDDCAAACPWSGKSGFCGARIHPECLRIENNGRVRVALSVPAKEWFDMLGKLGETLQLSRNAVAVLGKLGMTPEIEDWRNPVLPRDRTGLFAPNLAEYASLWAVREFSPTGPMHGLEARDLAGDSFQRIFLSGGARRDIFGQFVTDYQSPPEEAGLVFVQSGVEHASLPRNRVENSLAPPAFGARREGCETPVHWIPGSSSPGSDGGRLSDSHHAL